VPTTAELEEVGAVDGTRTEDASRRATVEALGDQVTRLTKALAVLKSQVAARHAATGEGHGIEFAAYALLFVLVKEGPRRASALAEAACVDPSTVSRQVAELVRAGLVERVPDPDDGRASLLVATARGRELHAVRVARRHQMFERVLAGWSGEDLATLTALLDRFTDDFVTARSALLDEMAPAAPHSQTQILEHSAS
jgi:DNA-binding MarR family transcriptional regulator